MNSKLPYAFSSFAIAMTGAHAADSPYDWGYWNHLGDSVGGDAPTIPTGSNSLLPQTVYTQIGGGITSGGSSSFVSNGTWTGFTAPAVSAGCCGTNYAGYGGGVIRLSLSRAGGATASGAGTGTITGTVTQSAAPGSVSGGGSSGAASVTFSGTQFFASGFSQFQAAINGGTSTYKGFSTNALGSNVVTGYNGFNSNGPTVLGAPDGAAPGGGGDFWTIGTTGYGRFVTISGLNSPNVFVAGQMTPTADMQALQQGNISATYNGFSYAYAHTVSINVNFGPGTWSGSWTNSSTLNGALAAPNFNASGTVTGANISGTVAAAGTVTGGSVTGNFVGPMAAGLIGQTAITTSNRGPLTDVFAVKKVGAPGGPVINPRGP
jgi:hypothetical protein